MSMLEHALQYAARGWRVFRLTGYKTPFKGSHGFKDGTVDAEVIERWWSETPRANIGLATGLPTDPLKEGEQPFDGPNIVVFDADGPGGLTELQEACKSIGGIPRTLTARTSKGWHFYYYAPPGVRIKGVVAEREEAGEDGLDIKADKGYVVLPPSINAQTGWCYPWANNDPIVVMPPALVEFCATKKARRRRGPVPISSSAPSAPLGPFPQIVPSGASGAVRLADRALAVERQGELREFLGALTKVSAACGYEQWFERGAAIHDFDPSESGLAIFKAWSRTAEKYRTDEDAADCERKWLEYAIPKPGVRLITKATIYALANQTIALERKQDSRPSEADHGSVNGAHALPSIFTDVSENSVKGSDNALIQLNEKYATIGDVGGKCLILGWVPSKIDDSVTVPSFQSFKAFSERYAHKYVKVKKVDGKGRPVLADDGTQFMEDKQLGQHWLKWPGRRSFEGIDLAPNQPPVLPGGVLNLWNGFAVQAAISQSEKRGGFFGDGWSRMHDHIVHILASGDQASADYIIKFAAWAVQNPGERAEAALVFRGEKGTGKGTFANALRRIFGQHGLQIFNSKHMVGQFNAHLRNCLLLFADEAFWAGDKQGEPVLKGMLTEPTLMIEQKGVDATSWKNRLHVVMSANADWIVPASHDERRYSVFDVSSARRGDEKYFADLHNELTSGGLNAMLWDLLHMDLAGWHPRKIVSTEALRQQKIRSMGPLDDWWEGVLQLGVYPVTPLIAQATGVTRRTAEKNDLPASVEMIPAAALLHAARDTHPKLNQLSAQAFGRFMKSLQNEGYHRSEGNHWEFLELKQARELFERKFGKWEWEAPKDTWTTRGLKKAS